MIYPKNWEKVICSDWCEDENKIWLCLENKNAICEIDKKSKDTKILGSFPHNGLGERQLSLSTEKNGDYIFFCPFKANDIAMLRISTGELKFIDLSHFWGKGKYTGTEIRKFYRMFCYKNYVLFFGIKYPAIMRFDLITKKLEFYDGWLEEVERHKCKDTVFFTDGYAQKGNEIYLPIGRCKGILKLNLDTMECEYIELGIAVCGILGMTQWEGFVWLTEQDTESKRFFQWNLDTGEVTQIELPCQDAFYAPLYYRKSLLFFRNYRNKSYRFELESGHWEDITNVMPGAAYFGDKKVQGEEIAYFSKDGRFYHWNPKMKSEYFDEFKIEDANFLKNSWMDYCECCEQELKKHIVKEGSLSVRDYIDVIGAV